jgi:cob(I)alamin adenosyltransferase
MTHLPYIAGAYALFLAGAAALALDARTRLRRAERRLAALEPRAPRPVP